MNLSINRSIGIPILDKIIDRNPVTIKYDTSALAAIAIMSQIEGQSIFLSDRDKNCCCSETEPKKRKSSYVLVIKGTELVGIFTERDLVKLIASQIDLTNKKISEVMTANPISLRQYHDRDVSVAVAIMRERNIRHLPVIGSWGQLIGIITQENIRSALTPGSLLKMRCVADVMSFEVVSCSQDLSLLDAAKLMRDRQVSCVVIVAKKADRQIPLGIITERDLVQFRVLELDFAKTNVATVMSRPLFTIDPDYCLWQTHQLMMAQKVRRLVVAEKSGELAGIVTQSSIMAVFDPLEMSRVITVLQHQVKKSTRELEQINHELDRAQTQLKQQQQQTILQLERQQRFEAIANNLAKDFDLLITPILENARILALNFPERDPQTQQLLQKIIANSQRGIDLIEQIFSVASKIDKGFVPVSIDRILSKVLHRARGTFPQSIEIFLDLSETETIPQILGNAAQLERIFMNLCFNSQNALADRGGIIRIGLESELLNRNLATPDRECSAARKSDLLAGLELEPYLVVTVWDNGTGMSRSLKKQIFEMVANPQKTTPNNRSGIFTVINTVTNHDGFVNIESEIDRGTQFKVYLPVLEAKSIQLAYQHN